MQLLDSMGTVGLKGKRHRTAERAPGDLTNSAVAGKRGVLACLGTHSRPSHFPRRGIEKPWHLLGISTENLPVRPGNPFSLDKWVQQMLPCFPSCLYARGKCFNRTFPLLSTNVHLSDISSAFAYEDSSTHIHMQISNSNDQISNSSNSMMTTGQVHFSENQLKLVMCPSFWSWWRPQCMVQDKPTWVINENSVCLISLAFKNLIKSGRINSARHIDKDWGGNYWEGSRALPSSSVKPPLWQANLFLHFSKCN